MFWDIAGTKACCLLDSGCEGIMISSDFVKANKLPKFELEKPVILQLACMGSKSTVQYELTAKILLSKEKYDEYFDITNVDYYDIILGTLFLHRFEILLDFKKNCVQMVSPSIVATYGSSKPGRRGIKQRIYGVQTRISINESDIPVLREAWQNRYVDIFGDIPLELPPFREVNHEIKLIDPTKVIRYRTPRCPETLKEQLIDKINQYVTAGWWRQTSTQQAVPVTG
ncbi:hypothetical protein M422DRAFT_189230 [Sphaerobolus stellatus SS14]|uniref:Unplaced genomic scaffold SPHSTscaffold_221, whole genome shotgun sequence n=1 Tax=Sphaerobolus stellatus (strain SS14) TaxID=990650 RepID=A0A0C9UUI6_SPHS4|nr:hypothetical protein M422DRAFT_189230 [Sphaerobolus stellatus SS14]